MAHLYLYQFRDFKFRLTRSKNPKAGALTDALVGRPRTYPQCGRFKMKIQNFLRFQGVANRDGFFVYDGGVEELDAMIRAVIGSASKSAPVSDVESEDLAESAESAEAESAESAELTKYRSKLITAQEMIIDLQAKLLKEASPSGPTRPTSTGQAAPAAVAYLSNLTEAYVRKHNRYPKTVRFLTESSAATSELPGTDDEQLNVMLQDVIRTLKRQRSRHHRVEPSTSTEVEAM